MLRWIEATIVRVLASFGKLALAEYEKSVRSSAVLRFAWMDLQCTWSVKLAAKSYVLGIHYTHAVCPITQVPPLVSHVATFIKSKSHSVERNHQWVLLLVKVGFSVCHKHSFLIFRSNNKIFLLFQSLESTRRMLQLCDEVSKANIGFEYA
jgi:hypothetical protein